jgi:hypothetical protein
MLYKAQSNDTGNMWDVWLYHHAGTYYLFSLCTTKGGIGDWDNISMARSPDGVQWTEIGPVLTMDEGVTWMGTGSTWRNPGGRPAFQINFSLWKGLRQTIFFAQSDDLVHWTKCGPAQEFVQDERWYEPNGRWDCIWTIPRPGGGLYGYWTASPKPETGGQFGFGESADGITWQALEPPRVQGVGEGEVGAVECIGDRYIMIFGTKGHMEALTADAPQGPFTVFTRNRILLGGHTYFARFFPSPSGLLVCHHSIARDRQVCCAPLKRATLDQDGALRLRWWSGNDRLKRQRLTVELPARQTPVTPVDWLRQAFDAKAGVVLEGRLRLPAAGEGRSGLFIECGADQGAAVLLDAHGVTEVGLQKADGADFKADFTVNRDLTFGAAPAFRLLLKGSMIEFYLDELLIECYSLPSLATGRIGLLTGGAEAAFTDLAAWQW